MRKIDRAKSLSDDPTRWRPIGKVADAVLRALSAGRATRQTAAGGPIFTNPDIGHPLIGSGTTKPKEVGVQTFLGNRRRMGGRP